MLITKDDIAETTHNLDDQAVVENPTSAAAITGSDLEDALPAGLLDRLNACALQVFAQEHDKRGWITGNFCRFKGCQVCPGKLRVGREVEPAILPSLSLIGGITLQCNSVHCGLNNGIDARAYQKDAQLIGDSRQGHSIDIHEVFQSAFPGQRCA